MECRYWGGGGGGVQSVCGDLFGVFKVFGFQMFSAESTGVNV